MIIDSHCHLDRVDLTPFEGSILRVLEAAKALGVEKVLCVSIDRENFQQVLSLAHTYEHVYASVGVHPTETGIETVSYDWLMSHAQDPKVVAIGETGLDYYHEPIQADLQKASFEVHLQAAIAADKPVIIHTRMANQDTIAQLKPYAGRLRGVFHCFTESWEMAKAGLDLGLYISFSGILTFKNASELRDVAWKIPLDRLLVETDAPYLTPHPFRGKPNHPGLTRYVVETLARLKGMPWEDMAAITTQNACDLFRFP
jgi:TatD DNase family protein